MQIDSGNYSNNDLVHTQLILPSYSDELFVQQQNLTPVETDDLPAKLVAGELLVPAEQEKNRQPALLKSLDNHLLIWTFLLTFGPLALPLVMVSSKYSILWKCVITLMTISLTIVLPIAMTLYFADYSLWPILEAMQQANGSIKEF